MSHQTLLRREHLLWACLKPSLAEALLRVCTPLHETTVSSCFLILCRSRGIPQVSHPLGILYSIHVTCPVHPDHITSHVLFFLPTLCQAVSEPEAHRCLCG